MKLCSECKGAGGRDQLTTAPSFVDGSPITWLRWMSCESCAGRGTTAGLSPSLLLGKALCGLSVWLRGAGLWLERRAGRVFQAGVEMQDGAVSDLTNAPRRRTEG